MTDPMLDETPLVPQFTFAGLEWRGKYTFANVDVFIAAEDPESGHFSTRLQIPVRLEPEVQVAQIRDRVLALAREIVSTSPVLPWLSLKR